MVPVVMVSSTAKDLSEYRQQVKDACMRLGVHPLMMEHLPAVDADAIAESLAMVDASEIYLGVFAHRYGYVPAGHNISITEMEYERAVQKGIPRLLFLADENVPAAPEYADRGPAGDKLKKLKERIKAERVVKFFRDPTHLREEVILSLAVYCNLANREFRRDRSAIPEPPTPYVAHPYLLLQTSDLIGRQRELGVLTDWIMEPARFKGARILTIVGVGGSGKSALTWKWFSDISPRIVRPLSGQLWWSFYEPDATFESFVNSALAYVSTRPIEEIAQETFSDRERELLAALDRHPYVIVFDGLERALTAYVRSDAPRMPDAAIDEAFADRASSPAQSASRRYHQLRATADPRAGKFLRSLTRVQASRILISTRLHPSDLQLLNGEPVPGCFTFELPGLTDRDAMALWHAYGAGGDPATLIPLFQRFDSHPLLIQALANEVVNFRAAPGDLAAWRKAHPEFDPFSIPLEEVKSHVLYAALRGLSASVLRTLQVIAALRMPAHFDTLAAILVRTYRENSPPPVYDSSLGSFGDILKFSLMRRGDYDRDFQASAAPRSLTPPYETVAELDRALTELEGRGVVGWDRRVNRYDLHPITRAVAWAGLSDDERSGIHKNLLGHFEALPRFDQQHVKTLEELAPAIELFGTLVALGRYPEAAHLYELQLSPLNDIEPRLALELLESLFRESKGHLGIESLRQAQLLRDLGMAYRSVGRPDLLVATLQPSLELLKEDWDRVYPLCDVASEACVTGQIFTAEAAARRAVVAGRAADPQWLQAVALFTLARCLTVRNAYGAAVLAINRSQVMFQRRAHENWAARARVLGLEMLLRHRFPIEVLQVSTSTADELAKNSRFVNSAAAISLQRIRASAEGLIGGLAGAEKRLEQTLAEAHSRHWIDEELAAMIALAEIRRRQGKGEPTRLLLNDARELARRGQYRLHLADIENTNARLALDEGDRTAAAAAAVEAYRLSWCDGPPFAYAWGLSEAAAHLEACRTAPPDDLAPFDPARHEAMPDVAINPDDEWHIDEEQFGTILISGFGKEPTRKGDET